MQRAGKITALALALAGVVLFAGAIIGGSAAAQGVQPHLFFGAAEDSTVDGQAMAAGAALEAVSQGGAVLATAEWEGNFWFLTIPGEHNVVLFRVGEAVSAATPITPGNVSSDAVLGLITPGTVETRTVGLGIGWNLTAWLGPGTPVADAVAGLGGALQGLFTWDPAGQRFLRYQPGGPAFLNTVATLEPGQGVWVLLTADADWDQDFLPGLQQRRSVRLVPGFNLIAWTGPEGLDPTAAFGVDPTVLGGAFTFDGAGQQFRRFQPGGLAALNSLTGLPFGSGLWLQANAAADFSIPGADEAGG